MISRPFEKQDIFNICLQPAQQGEIAADINCPTITILNDKNEPMAIVGIIEQDKNRATVWSLISCKAGPFMPVVAKIFKRLIMLYETDYIRLEMIVKSDFKQGHRFAGILGFKREGTMKKFYKEQDYDLYGRVK